MQIRQPDELDQIRVLSKNADDIGLCFFRRDETALACFVLGQKAGPLQIIWPAFDRDPEACQERFELGLCAACRGLTDLGFCRGLRGAVFARRVRHADAFRQWHITVAGNANPDIKRRRSGDDEAKDQGQAKRFSMPGLNRAVALAALVGIQQATGDLGADGLGLRLAQDAACEVAVHLRKLVFVDRHIGQGAVMFLRRAPRRDGARHDPGNGQNDCGRHGPKKEVLSHETDLMRLGGRQK